MRVTMTVLMLTFALSGAAIAAPPTSPGLPEPIMDARVFTWRHGPGDIRSVRLEGRAPLAPVVASVGREGQSYCELHALGDKDRPMLSWADTFLVESSFDSESLAVLAIEPDGGGLGRLVVHVVLNPSEEPEILMTVPLAVALPLDDIVSNEAGQLISESGCTSTSSIAYMPASLGDLPLARAVDPSPTRHVLPTVPSPIDINAAPVASVAGGPRLLGFDGGWLALWNELGSVHCRVISSEGIVGESVEIGAGTLLGASRVGGLVSVVLAASDGEPHFALLRPGLVPGSVPIDTTAAGTPVADLRLSVMHATESRLVSLKSLIDRRGRLTLEHGEWRADLQLGHDGRLRVRRESSQGPPVSIGIGDLQVLDGWADASGFHVLAWQASGSSPRSGRGLPEGQVISLSLREPASRVSRGGLIAAPTSPVHANAQARNDIRPPIEPFDWDAHTDGIIRPPIEPFDWDALNPLLPTPLPTASEWTLGVRAIFSPTRVPIDLTSALSGPNEPLEPIDFRIALPDQPLVIELRHVASVPGARVTALD